MLHGDVTVHSSAQIQLLNKNTCSDTNLNANTTRKDEGVVGCKVMLQCKIWLEGDRCTDVVDDDLGNDDVYGVADDVDDVVVMQGGVAVQHGSAQVSVVMLMMLMILLILLMLLIKYLMVLLMNFIGSC